MKKHIILLCALIPAISDAGLFLDLEVGTHVNGWNGSDCEYDYSAYLNDSTCQPPAKYLGSGLLGRFRAGYQTGAAKLGPINISGQLYYEHTSDTGDSYDTGIDVIMGGIRIE